MASAAALKMAALCMLVLCIASSQVITTVVASPANHQQDAAAGAALRGIVQNIVAEELGLAGAGDDGRNVGDACPAACQNCLILCAVKCVLKPSPVACYADCIIKDACFT